MVHALRGVDMRIDRGEFIRFPLPQCVDCAGAIDCRHEILGAKLAADGKVVASPNLKFLLYESVTHCSEVLLLVNGYQLLGTVRVDSGRLGPSGPRCLVDICVRQHGQL